MIDLVCLGLKIELWINWLQYRQRSLIFYAKLPCCIAFMLHCRGALLEFTSRLFGLEIDWDVTNWSHPESILILAIAVALIARALFATGKWVTALLTAASFYYINKGYVSWVFDQLNITIAGRSLAFFFVIRWLWQLHISHASLVTLRWSLKLVSIDFESVN